MSVSLNNMVICKYNLRGMCRFGKRCRNIHEDPEKFVQKLEEKLLANKPSESSDPQLEGACALSPSKSKGKSSSMINYTNKYEPGSSSNEYLSKDAEEKTCGICFDVVTKKVNRFEQTFGILPNCNHCFCFTCIKKWRQSKEFETEVSKSCPECRIASDFVYPAKYWMEDKEKKDTYIINQKRRMKKLDCKFFRKGKGKCPFGNTCFYLHALPNGKELDVGPPKPRRRRRGNSGEELVHQILFWLNDSDLDIETTDSEPGSDFDLDLDDPCIAYQYYDHDDIRRYIALDRLMNLDSDSHDDSEMNFFLV